MQPALQHRIKFRRLNVKELAVILELALRRPQAQYHVQHLGGAAAHVVALAGVHAEQLQVGGYGAMPDTPVEPAPGQVIQHGDAVRQFDGVVDGQQRNAGGQSDVLRQRRRLGDHQVGVRRVLPALGEVLTDPGLVEPQLVGGL